MSEIQCREAILEDVDAIVALVSAAYRGEESTKGWTSEHHLLHGQRADASMVSSAISDPAGVVLLAEEGSAVLGCIQVAHAGAEGHFGMFAVDPALQAGGVGSRLLDRAEELARDRWGCSSMDLEVIAQRDTLIEFYARRGYGPTGERTPFPYGDERFGIPQRDDLYFVVLRRDF